MRKGTLPYSLSQRVIFVSQAWKRTNTRWLLSHHFVEIQRVIGEFAPKKRRVVKSARPLSLYQVVGRELLNNLLCTQTHANKEELPWPRCKNHHRSNEASISSSSSSRRERGLRTRAAIPPRSEQRFRRLCFQQRRQKKRAKKAVVVKRRTCFTSSRGNCRSRCTERQW